MREKMKVVSNNKSVFIVETSLETVVVLVALLTLSPPIPSKLHFAILV